MSHDYSQYDPETLLNTSASTETDNALQYKAKCEDCGWVNRRTFKVNAERSMKSHENRNHGHDVNVVNDGGPFDE